MIGKAGAAAAPPGPAEFPAAMAHPPGAVGAVGPLTAPRAPALKDRDPVRDSRRLLTW